MNWDELESKCKECKNCILREGRTNVVFGSGWREAELMIIGEGPGEQEDKQGLPFVGRAGALLDDMLGSIGLRRQQVYIANIVKCRPPGNRDPLDIEKEACIGWLEAQIELLKPKFILCLGRIAASRIIYGGAKDFKITAERGTWFEQEGIRVMATYHPAYMLRDPRRRPECFADLKKLESAMLEVCTRTEFDSSSS